MQTYTGVDEAALDALWRPFTQHALRQAPFVIVEGRGCTLVDAEGKEYLDAMAGLWCVNVGYGQERLVEAATTQLRQLAYSPLSRPAPAALEPAKRLAQLLPGDLNHVTVLNSRPEAGQAALEITGQYGLKKDPAQ